MINLSLHETKMLFQALGYAVAHAKTEAETAEFGMLYFKVAAEVLNKEAEIKRNAEHKKKDCPFNYCDSNPSCKGICRYSDKINNVKDI